MLIFQKFTLYNNISNKGVKYSIIICIWCNMLYFEVEIGINTT